MKLIHLRLRNFRRYENAKFQFHPQFTVLIGENGKGKTTILDAIAVMLGTYFLGSKIKTGQSVLRKADARLIIREKGGQVFFEQQKEVYLTAKAVLNDLPHPPLDIDWQRDIGDRGGKEGARLLRTKGAEDWNRVIDGENVNLPLLLYYGAGRLWNIHHSVTTEKPGSQFDAYRYCLDPKSDHKAFEKWFKKLSYSELQKRQKLPALEAVKQAVLSCIPEALEFYHDTELDQIVIKLDQEGLVPFNNLSDGYRNIVAMVADIAHRAARLNPHLEAEAAQKTEGIVLIDEIDLHLHPKWQRRVVRDLQKAFPEMQFIATTHSPFILQSLDPGEVIDLNHDALPEAIANVPLGIAAPGPADQYSNRSIEDIVEDVMGVAVPSRSERYQEMYQAAKDYYQHLQYAKDMPPEQIEPLKRKLDELSAPFSDNVAYHAFLEMERMAAGLGKSEQGRNR
jgi:predicted ATP-binding protein involved in virulence